jgi:N utilization substance protein A
MLVGKEIEVWRDLPKDELENEEEDVLLSAFDDDIEPWIIEKLQSIGCDTAKSVLALSAADIAKRADLEDETVAEILDILRAEFEDDEE